jgi:signal transduction histidine kinase
VAGLALAGTREIAELSHSLVTMAETLEARADYIRGFAAEVSHEFKTPLAAMRGTVELLQEHLATMTEAERRSFLANLAEDVTRLDRLVRRLLDLARADVMRRSGPGRR